MTQASALPSRRLLIPRWRRFATTLQLNELSHSMLGNETFGINKTNEFEIKLNNVKTNPNLISDAELVETALVVNRLLEAEQSAIRLLSDESDAKSITKDQAATVLRRIGKKALIPAKYQKELNRTQLKFRELINLNQRNPIAWIDLALEQTSKGHIDNAKRSVSVALQLSPNNRHVLRAATRFYVHVGEIDRAHRILIRSDSSKNDPWVVAAEISVGQILNEAPKLTKRGAEMIESDQRHPRHISELAGALATLELGANRKRLRRLFDRSMEDPTGNSLAQAAWAGPKVGIDIIASTNQTSRATAENEASAYRDYENGWLVSSLSRSSAWLQEEPYSIRPIQFSASISGMIGEFERSIELCDQGLLIDKKNIDLQLTKAFALSSIGKFADANSIFDRLYVISTDYLHKYYITANRGLIAFRSGQSQIAKNYYREALAGFQRLGAMLAFATAYAYYAEEALNSNDEELVQILKEACSAAKRYGQAVPARETLRRIHQKLEKKEMFSLAEIINSAGILLPAEPLIVDQKKKAWFIAGPDGNPISPIHRIE
ncbi:MAG: hypothetical protein IOC90_01240 [Methylocystis sp.]|nr:hypothetical protein [Methylocystis sp.]MCA3584005.1 hypothetical protein [Methylocystis sp.]MCA3586649.1 hypothetical protein [Methylocystis sp.]MCA3591531.1 hypothetical protein [Methylocystis sp.]